MSEIQEIQEIREGSPQAKLDAGVWACAGFGDAIKVAELLSQGAGVGARLFGLTPLLLAAQKGHTDVCELLLSNGSDLEER